MRRALLPADRAARALAQAPWLVLTWLLAAAPPIAAGAGLTRHALRSGLPAQSGQMLALLGWAALLVVAAGWYLLGQAFLLRQAQAALRGEPVPALPSLRALLEQMPWLARAHAARLGVSALGLLPLGAGLPLARLLSSSWPVLAALRPGVRTSPTPPPLSVVTTQVGAWLLWALTTLNLALGLAWIGHGLPSAGAALLPRLLDPQLWALAGLLALTLSEPWRLLALVAALGLDGAPREPPEEAT